MMMYHKFKENFNIVEDYQEKEIRKLKDERGYLVVSTFMFSCFAVTLAVVFIKVLTNT